MYTLKTIIQQQVDQLFGIKTKYKELERGIFKLNDDNIYLMIIVNVKDKTYNVWINLTDKNYKPYITQ